MSTRPMKPAGGRGAMSRSNPVAGVVPASEGRSAMGTDAFRLVDDASAREVRRGFDSARPSGMGESTAIFGSAEHRYMDEVSGPAFGIRARRTAVSETYPGTLANGRLFRPAASMDDSFVSEQEHFGPAGPGQSGGSNASGVKGSRRPKGSWSPPNKGRTS